ncbi:MAG: insulinase family protein, partial [Bdellovibrionaceae bacterium]|nr:insulinase family protein [Pseudobdellovibrionaceae bacterium]
MANKFQLKNGLEVLMLKNDRSQVVSVQMWVKTGSADEPKGYEGISHFIEHLVFKGTQKYGVGEIAGLVESLGGELNAYTSFEKTVFHVTISSAYQEVAVDVISQMIFFPSFLPTEVDAEREVVCEEIRRNRDNPNRKATELHFSTVFQGHPYGKPVIGLEKTIKNISTERIKKYFEKNYSPRNMFLIVAGNFDHKKMKALIEKKFSKIEKSASKRKRRAAPKKQSSLKVRCAQSTFSQERVIFSWQIPKVESGEIEALEILACILGQGDSSRLVKELRLQSPLVNGVGVYVYKFSDCGLFFVSLNCEKEKFAEAVRGVLRQISDVKNKDVTADEVIKAINIFSSGEVYESETVDGQAFKAGEGYFYKRDVDYQKKALQRIAKLRPKDLRRVAQRFLNTDRMTVTSLGSMQSSEAKRIIRRAIKAEFARNSSNPSDKHKASVGRLPIRLRKVPAKMKEPIHYITDASGARLIIKPIKDLPFSALRVGFLAGSRIDSGKELGRAELWSRVAATGAEGLSEIEINTKIDSLAAALSPFGGRNTSGFTSEFLTPTKEEIWNLIVQLLLKPKVSTEAVEREKQIILNQIRARNDSPLRVATREFTKAIFKGPPYG